MDFGLLALILVVAGTVLDYIAPKTKTAVDDTIRDLVHKALPMLPAAKAATAARAAATVTVEGSKPAPSATPGLAGFKVRDHR